MYEIIGRNKFEPSFPNIKWDFGCVCVFFLPVLNCSAETLYIKIAREKN